MAARLLLDDHISHAVATALQQRGIDAVPLATWQDGRYRTSPDSQILRAAIEEDRVFVSYDVSSIPNLVREFAAAQVEQAGVILVSSSTIPEGDVGGLVAALERLLTAEAEYSFRNQMRFLPK